MNTNEVGAVLNMVCDKIGLAVEKAQPLAEEVVRQYAAKNLMHGIVAGTATVLALFVALILCFVAAKKDGDCDEAFIPYMIGGTIAAVALTCGVGITCECIGNYIAPLCGLLGK